MAKKSYIKYKEQMQQQNKGNEQVAKYSGINKQKPKKKRQRRVSSEISENSQINTLETLTELFKSETWMNEQVQKNWKDKGPFDFEKMIKEGHFKFDENKPLKEVNNKDKKTFYQGKQWSYGHNMIPSYHKISARYPGGYCYFGQVDTNGNPNGIGRYITQGNRTDIIEGSIDNEGNGYARRINSTGQYIGKYYHYQEGDIDYVQQLEYNALLESYQRAQRRRRLFEMRQQINSNTPRSMPGIFWQRKSTEPCEVQVLNKEDDKNSKNQTDDFDDKFEIKKVPSIQLMTDKMNENRKQKQEQE